MDGKINGKTYEEYIDEKRLKFFGDLKFEKGMECLCEYAPRQLNLEDRLNNEKKNIDSLELKELKKIFI